MTIQPSSTRRIWPAPWATAAPFGRAAHPDASTAPELESDPAEATTSQGGTGPDAAQAPSAGDNALPTMEQLSSLSAELDAIDAILARMDAGTSR